MFLVCVRRVFRDTVSSRAMSGPSRSDPSSPEHLQLAFAQGLDQALPGRSDGRGCAGMARGVQESPDVVPPGPLFRDPSQQRRHRWSLADEHANVPLGFGQGQRALQPRHRIGDVAAGVVGERLEHQDLDDASRPFPGFGRLEKALQEPGRIGDGRL